MIEREGSAQRQEAQVTRLIDDLASMLKVHKTYNSEVEKMKAIKEALSSNQSKQQAQLQGMKTDQKFNTFIFNVSTLDSLYKEYFSEGSKLPPGMTQSERNASILEIKNRNFKDLYNIIEESILKIYDLYVEA